MIVYYCRLSSILTTLSHMDIAYFSSYCHSKMLLKSGLGFAVSALFSVKKDSAQESFAITYDPLRWFPENEAIFCDSHNDAILDKHD